MDADRNSQREEVGLLRTLASGTESSFLPLNLAQTPPRSRLSHTTNDAFMQLSDLFYRFFCFLLPPALIGTAYLYLYPFFHQCGFPAARHSDTACYFGDDTKRYLPGDKAPFRLLALGDPQLEGDTSLRQHGNAELFPSLRRILNEIGHGGLSSLTTSLSEESKRLWNEDIPKALKTYHKKLDLWGNDLYLAHIYRTINWYTDPTHVVVLGDLLGSQWIDDKEFARRSKRFWRRVVSGGQKVPQLITDASATKTEILGADTKWKSMIITVAGNHDIGYAGDIDQHRIERFEHAYGRVNWDIHFALNETTTTNANLQPSIPELRLVILNSMNLDGPAADHELHQASMDFLNKKLYDDVPHEDTGAILLTHIPLHKEDGICVDGPFFDYFLEHQGGGIKEQNHLSYHISERILNGIVGPGRKRKAIILNGHDHAGCDTYHSKQKDFDIDAASDALDRWTTQHYRNSKPQVSNSSLTGVREVTVRSMMGEFGGNAGLLSAWWDKETKEWKFDYSHCMCGVQHIWWAVHVLDIIVIVLCFAGPATAGIEELLTPNTETTDQHKKRQ